MPEEQERSLAAQPQDLREVGRHAESFLRDNRKRSVHAAVQVQRQHVFISIALATLDCPYVRLSGCQLQLHLLHFRTARASAQAQLGRGCRAGAAPARQDRWPAAQGRLGRRLGSGQGPGRTAAQARPQPAQRGGGDPQVGLPLGQGPQARRRLHLVRPQDFCSLCAQPAQAV